MSGPEPHCPVCLGAPAPTTTCRMCGAEGEPFVVGEEASGWSRQPTISQSLPPGATIDRALCPRCEFSRACGLQRNAGEDFIVCAGFNSRDVATSAPRPDFRISEAGDLIRAENQHLRTVLRHIADTSEDEFSRELARKAIE